MEEQFIFFPFQNKAEQSMFIVFTNKLIKYIKFIICK